VNVRMRVSESVCVQPAHSVVQVSGAFWQFQVAPAHHGHVELMHLLQLMGRGRGWERSG